MSVISEAKNQSLVKIAASVCAVHFVLLLVLLQFNSQVIPQVKSVQKLVVKTVNLNERKSTSKAIPQSAPAPEPIALAEPVAEVKKETIPVEEETHVVPKVKPKKVEPQKKPKPEVKKTPPKTAKVEKKEVPKKKPVSNSLPKPEPKKAVPKSLPKPEPKKVEKSKPAKPQVDQQKEAANAKKRELIAKAQESIAKIDNTRGKIASAKLNSTAPVPLPAPIQGLHIDALPVDETKPLNVHEAGYRDELASRLKLLLRLPEHGEVRIKLTLERSGKVCKVAIVNSQSGANSKYIEKTLPALTFPSFGNNFGNYNQYTFLITLSNDL